MIVQLGEASAPLVHALAVDSAMTPNVDCSSKEIAAEADNVLNLDLHGNRTGRPDGDRTKIVFDGRELINFGSNDYLGLAADPRILKAVTDAISRYGWGSAASSSLGGRGPVHAQLEQRLAGFVDAEGAILFSSGYAANLDTVRALVSNGDVIYCDEQNHGSILDAARLSGAAVFTYRHSDCVHLSSLLKNGRRYHRRLIASESLFGSDGSLAPLPDLGDLAEKYDAKLLIDESHAIGAYGDLGQGAAAFLRQRDCLVARVGTLGKALGGLGGFVAGRESLLRALTDHARCYQHSTALPAAVCAAALAALTIVEAEPCRRTVLSIRAADVRERLLRQGWDVRTSASHIIPVRFEQTRRAESIAAALRDAGYFLPCVAGAQASTEEAILRLRINFGHEPWMIEGLLSSLSELA